MCGMPLKVEIPSGLQLPFEIYKGAGALSLVINIKLVPQLHVMSQILGS